MTRWQASVMNIKHSIADLDPAGGDELFHRWLAQVGNHINEWGKEYVPADVRNAVNDVERNINVPVTNWED